MFSGGLVAVNLAEGDCFEDHEAVMLYKFMVCGTVNSLNLDLIWTTDSDSSCARS